jgi:hypothetical protein
VIAAVSHKCRQICAQLFEGAKIHWVFRQGKLFFLCLISNEALGEIPRLWRGSAHWAALDETGIVIFFVDERKAYDSNLSLRFLNNSTKAWINVSF